MGEAFDTTAMPDAITRMLLAPHRPTPGAWWAEREPSLRRLSDEAAQIEVSSDQRHGLVRDEAALLVDRLLAPVARGRGALDLAIGECLGALSEGDRTLRLGYVSIGDYAREKLGIAARTAQAMAQLSRELRQAPLLRDAVLRGEVSASKARAILRVIFGDNEAAWVERARAETVRALAKAVKAERGEDEAEEAWDKVCLPLSAAERAEVDEALVLAGKAAGTMPPRPQRLEAMAQEFLSEYPDPADDEAAGEPGQEGCQDRCCLPGHAEADVGGPAGAAAATSDGEADVGGPARATAAASDAEAAGAEPRHRDGGEAAGRPAASARRSPPTSRGFLSWPVEDWLEATKEALEVETRRWEALGVLDPVEAPRAGEDADPRALDLELRRLMGLRRRWDELLGHLGLVMKSFGLWRELGFASFDHYCLERLWMASRTVEQRTWLERRCYDLPGLKEALRSGRLSYEQARLVAGKATPENLEDWVRRAEGMTCIDLRRSIELDGERQMCARGTLELLVPARVADLLAAAFRAAQKKAGHWLSPGECLLEISRHFKKTWQGVVDERSTPQRKARRRDEYCQVPGCSRLAAQAHHLVRRSAGGGNEPENLVGVCTAHHLHCIHRGWIRVSGRAPDKLVWELGVFEEDDPAQREATFA